MYKTAIVAVSGGRARGHAEAYQHIKRGTLAAISTRNRDNLDNFGEKYNIKARYTDYREMFAKEKPDLVHVNTPPDVRLEVMEAAKAEGVGSLIIEKPLAIQGEDFLAIRDFAAHSNLKVAINHQLHFHPRRMALQQLVQDGKIGEIRFIDASSRLNMAYQGTHTLQGIAAFHPNAKPVSIIGQVAGANGLEDTPRKHFAPDQCVGSLVFDDGVSAMLRCGVNAPFVLPGDERNHLHKRVAIYGTHGFVHWTMWSWEMSVNGKIERGEHQYPDEDILGQAAMTEAMFDWMEDDSQVHPLNLNAALQDFNIVLKIYMSAINHRLESLESEPQPDLINAMRNVLI